MPVMLRKRIVSRLSHLWSDGKHLIYQHAEKMSLVILFAVGMQQVSIIHLIYLLFFLVFFAQIRWAR